VDIQIGVTATAGLSEIRLYIMHANFARSSRYAIASNPWLRWLPQIR
jgi:hypothetical protein